MLLIDLHIHSIHSGHAYGSFYEIAAEAERKRMRAIAITDHGPSMEGTSGSIHFHMGRRAPKILGGVRILWGCEASIIGDEGELDVSKKIQERLDIVLAGMHLSSPYQDRGRAANTSAIISALKRNRINVFTHPTAQQFEYDMPKVVEACLEHDVLPELNLSYLTSDAETLASVRRMVEIVKSHGKQLIVGSDAHFLHEIGDDSKLQELGTVIGLSDDLVINNFPERLASVLNLSDL